MSGWAWASNRISVLVGRFELVTLEVSAFSGLGSCMLTTGPNFHNHWQTNIFACFWIWKKDNNSHSVLFLHHASECLCGIVVKTASRNRLWSNCLLHLPPRFLFLFRYSSFLFCAFNNHLFFKTITTSICISFSKRISAEIIFCNYPIEIFLNFYVKHAESNHIATTTGTEP